MPEKTIKVRVDSGNSKQEINELNSSMKGLGAQADKAGGRLGGMSRNAGQAGIQIQQFVGQVQGGQSAMLALSQQAADLGIVLGAPLVGAIVGLTASFAGLLIPSINNTNEEIKEILPSIDELAEKINELTTAQKDFLRSEIAKKIKEEEIQLSTVNNRINALIQSNRNLLRNEKENAKLIDSNTERLRKLRAERDQLISSINDQNAQILNLNGTIKGVNDEDSNRINKLVELNSALDQQIETLGLSNKELLLYRAAQLGATNEDINAIAKKYDLIEAYNQQITAEKTLLRTKQIAENYAQSVIDKGNSESDKFAQELVKLDELRAKGLISQQIYDEAIVASVTARTKQIEEQNKRTQQLENNYKDILINTAVSALNLTKNNNRKMTKEQKKQAKQSVYINTAAAIARAYGENNFYVASAMAVFLAAMQLRQINAIETASGGGGGDAGAPQIAAQPAQQQQQSSTFEILGLDTLIGELRESNGVISTDAVANMFESFRQAGQNGANTSLGG